MNARPKNTLASTCFALLLAGTLHADDTSKNTKTDSSRIDGAYARLSKDHYVPPAYLERQQNTADLRLTRRLLGAEQNRRAIVDGSSQNDIVRAILDAVSPSQSLPCDPQHYPLSARELSHIRLCQGLDGVPFNAADPCFEISFPADLCCEELQSARHSLDQACSRAVSEQQTYGAVSPTTSRAIKSSLASLQEQWQQCHPREQRLASGDAWSVYYNGNRYIKRLSDELDRLINTGQSGTSRLACPSIRSTVELVHHLRDHGLRFAAASPDAAPVYHKLYEHLRRIYAEVVGGAGATPASVLAQRIEKASTEREERLAAKRDQRLARVQFLETKREEQLKETRDAYWKMVRTYLQSRSTGTPGGSSYRTWYRRYWVPGGSTSYRTYRYSSAPSASTSYRTYTYTIGH